MERPLDFASVRLYFSAAATLPTDVERRWHARFGHWIQQGYGLTETSPFASYNHDVAFKPGSVGTPIENVEMKIVDPEDREVADGELGEIVIKGPNVMKGYFANGAATAESIRDGWFHSGDIGYRDADGYFFIVDRVKDMINVSGFKVFPREVEEVLFRHAAVKEAAVVGIADPVRGEAVKAFVVLVEGARASAEELQALCRAAVAHESLAPLAAARVARARAGAAVARLDGGTHGRSRRLRARRTARQHAVRRRVRRRHRPPRDPVDRRRPLPAVPLRERPASATADVCDGGCPVPERRCVRGRQRLRRHRAPGDGDAGDAGGGQGPRSRPRPHPLD